MHGLLRRIGIARDAVTVLAEPAAHGRERIVSEALRPAATTRALAANAAAPDFAQQADSRCASISVIEAANAEEEALAIAVALREAVETPGKTAALVTPDRALARRVLAALARWNVAVDDSGGDALADTPAGVFARLVAEAALGGLAPVTLLALLKHPLLRLGARRDAHTGAIAALELAVLRGPRPKPGTEGLIAGADEFPRPARRRCYRSDPRKQLSDAELDAADDWRAASPLRWRRWRNCRAQRRPSPRSPLRTARRSKHSARDRWQSRCLCRRRRQRARRGLRRDRRTCAAASFDMAPADYPDLFRAAIADRVVRRPDRPGMRVHIYGLLEARLQNVDRLVLGGLVEGVWPPETRSDPWLSRPMRHELGLDLPERRIGLSAHDFAQSLGAKEVDPHPRRQARPARRRSPRASCSGCGGRRRGALESGAGARRTDICIGRARSTSRRRRRSRCRARSRSRRVELRPTIALGHRDRDSGCAIPTRSMRAMFCACSRSMPSIRRPARATAAR